MGQVGYKWGVQGCAFDVVHRFCLRQIGFYAIFMGVCITPIYTPAIMHTPA